MTFSPTVIVGVAGAGKTGKAMELIEQRLSEGIRWDRIGFASFSRAACIEAAERAARITGVSQEQLMKEGYFRTLHSTALRCLGISGSMILDADSANGKKWYEEAFGACRGGEHGTLSSEIADALDQWDKLRSSLGRTVPQSCPDLHKCSACESSECEGDCVQIRAPEDTCTYLNKCQGDTTLEVVSPRDPVFYMVGDTGDTTEKVVVSPFAQHKTQGKNQKTSDFYPYRRNFHSEVANDRCARESKKNLKSSVTSVTCERKPLIGKEVKWGHYSEAVVSPVSPTQTVKTAQPLQFEIIHRYETHKRMTGKLDFTDILLKFAGFSAEIVVSPEQVFRNEVVSPERMFSNKVVSPERMFSGASVQFRQVYAEGTVPEIDLWIFDEYQDCSVLLDCVAERLSESAGEAVILGDVYQAVYGFSGSDWRVMRSREMDAKEEGKRVLLNRSWRNGKDVIKWGEEILRQDRQYDEREPWTDKVDGSVGMMEKRAFLDEIERIVGMDTMVIGRTWYSLEGVKSRLDQLTIPWRSCQETKKSRWESPVKIAYVITMRDLKAGNRISEQDWRRITSELPQKWQGRELFTRGTKAQWKKLECSGENIRRLDELAEWGATEFFLEFVVTDLWRVDACLLIDTAIQKYGIRAVREPRIRIGTVHSVKGMEARNVFCMASSSEKASGAATDFYEDLFLKYVAVTRASLNYRVVVDLVEHARGKPLFLACPPGYWNFNNTMPEDNEYAGEENSESNHPVDSETEWLLDHEISGFCDIDRDSRSDTLLSREISGDGSETPRSEAHEATTAHNDDYDLSWSKL